MAAKKKSPPRPNPEGLFCVGIDAGKPPKTVFASKLGVSLWHTSTDPACAWGSKAGSTIDYLRVVAERPKARAGQRVNPEGLISPAGWAMAGLFAIQHRSAPIDRYWVPVEVWKRALYGSKWNVPKAVFCAWVKADVVPDSKLDPENESDQDHLDAIGICQAAYVLTPDQLEPHRVAFV